MSTSGSITRDLYLLLTTDAGRSENGVDRRAPMIAAAVTDLIRLRRVVLGDGEDPRVDVLDPAPTGDAALDHVLEGLAEQPGRNLSELVGQQRLDPTGPVTRFFVESGVLAERRRLFGTRHETVDGAAEEALRVHLAAVVAGAVAPSPADAAVLGLLRALDLAHRILHDELPGVSRKDLRERIEEISEGVPTLDAVRASFDAMQAAMLSAAMVPIMVAVS